MSGIVGILHLDGAPIDRALLHRMTDFMTFRGPDEQRIWVEGNVGFGHTLLRTTFESEHEHQPLTLDGRVWIVADARVDAQADLIAKLASRGEEVERGATDVELLLRAYRVWGEDCVDHLLGDFAFAIWDGPRRRLFCARDHLGVKPFFYAHLGATVIFSNTLDCIREHPAVSDDLNDLAIADFLLFDLNQDPTTTSFADIQRIPPAYRATCTADGFRVSRYWTLPIDEPIYFKHADDYTDWFKELLDTAVSDRLRTNKIAISMSGGIDSPTLAATACKILRNRSSDSEVRAFTNVIDGLDGNERYYAGLVAEKLGIAIHFRDFSARIINSDWNETSVHTPEPVPYPTGLLGCGEVSAGFSRVELHGEGPDNALFYEWQAYLSYLMQEGNFRRLARDVYTHVIKHRRIPLLRVLPGMLKARRNEKQWHLSFPDWLNRSFESRLQLYERWQEMEHPTTTVTPHPWRPVAYRSLQNLSWERHFRSMDAEETLEPIEYRHPFVDVRLLRYMLSLPTIPWCRAKYVERRAMHGTLPDLVLCRSKSSLTSDPIWERARRFGLPLLNGAHSFADYVDGNRLPKDVSYNIGLFRVNFRPFAFNYWLQNLRQVPRHIINKENRDDGFLTKKAG